jgi:hypothetical protein
MSATFEGPNDREPEEYIEDVCRCEAGEGESFFVCDKCQASAEFERQRPTLPNEEPDIDF